MGLRPNIVPNGTMGGGAATTTLPFGWFFFTSAIGSVTHTLAFGTETSIAYMDIILTGTPGAGGTWNVVYGANFDASTLKIFGQGGTVYNVSANVKLQAGAWTNIVPTNTIQENGPVGTIRTDVLYVGSRTTGALDVNLYSGSVRMDPTCNNIFGILTFTFAAASAISATIRFGNPMIQQDDGLQSGGAPRAVAWY